MSWDLRDAILTGFIAATELLDNISVALPDDL